MKRIAFCTLLALAAVFPAAAQFSTSGSDPSRLKWSEVQTESYRVIFPAGLDSLATVYARNLERVKMPVSGSIGYVPNQAYRKKMQVVLHAYTAYGNGSVTWTPHRMELFAVPESYAPESDVWELQMPLHESRHVAQLQFGRDPHFTGWNIAFGQLTTGALSAIYCGPAFLEGDAVVAETALCPSGRGRTADFLEYYRCALTSGEGRLYWQWRYGSLTRYTPNHYASGYLTMGGIRALYDAPDFTARYYERIREHYGWTLLNLQKTVREVSGKSLEDAFGAVCDSLAGYWKRNDSLRGPFMPSQRVTAPTKSYVTFTGTTCGRDGALLSVRSGMAENAGLVLICPDGSQKRLRSFASTGSSLRRSEQSGTVYWSEQVRDPRWELRSFSDICCLDTLGKVRTVASGGRFYNPSPSPDGHTLAVTEYPIGGGSALVLMDAHNGRILSRTKAPGGMQIVESAWAGGKVYVSAITADGFCICEAGTFREVLSPRHLKIKQLEGRDGAVTFVCDLTGVNELYSLDPGSGALRRLTLTRCGASEFCLPGAGYRYYSVPRTDGRGIWKTAIEDLPIVAADWDAASGTYPIADALRTGEKIPVDADAQVEVSAAVPYSKLGHLFRFHSWAPLYVNFDAISSQSLESVSTTVNLGATAFWQNTLGTCYGYVGARLMDSGWNFRPSLHAKLTYAGLYPVVEASLNLNSRDARTTSNIFYADGSSEAVTGTLDKPLLSASAKVYVPLSFSSHGWSRGVIPQLSASVYNDGFGFVMESCKEDVYSYRAGHNAPLGRATASLRAYVMQSTPASRVYPRLGIGAEAGYSMSFNSWFCPAVYGQIYGYLPGFGQRDGFRMCAVGEHKISGPNHLFVESYVSTTPRGYSSAALAALAGYPTQAKLSVDYALPFANLEWGALCPVAYVRNLELTPHFDCSLFASSKGFAGTLTSAGASLSVVLGNLLWIPYDTRIGVRWSFNSGSLVETLQKNGVPVERHNFGFLFSVSL